MSWKTIKFSEVMKNGEEVEFRHKVDPALIEFMAELKKRSDPKKANRDAVIALSGSPGVGKSNTVNTCGYIFGNGFSLHTNVLFDPRPRQFHEWILQRSPQTFINGDEAIRLAYRRRAMSSQVVGLVELLNVCRKYNQITMFSLPDIFMMDKDVLKRMLVWVYMPDVTHGDSRKCVAMLSDRRFGKDQWDLNAMKAIAKKRLTDRIVESDPSDELDLLRETSNYWFEFSVKKLPDCIDSLYEYLAKLNAPEITYEKKTSGANSELVDKYRHATKILAYTLYKDFGIPQKKLQTMTNLSAGILSQLIAKHREEVDPLESIEDVVADVIDDEQDN